MSNDKEIAKRKFDLLTTAIEGLRRTDRCVDAVYVAMTGIIAREQQRCNHNGYHVDTLEILKGVRQRLDEAIAKAEGRTLDD